MKLKAIYHFAVRHGIARDPRDKEQVKQNLVAAKEEYDELPERKKIYFDMEKLRNPYADTRILYGDGEREVRGVLVGIDIGTGEVLLAERLREKGKPIDAIISHHPQGKALAHLYEIMPMQADILQQFGISINVAEGILAERIKDVSRRLLPLNHDRTLDAARLCDIPLLCIHTPADNSVTRYLQTIFDEKKPERIKDVLDIILEVPEYQAAAKNNMPPTLAVGNENNRCGKIFVDMTGGTGGSKEAFAKLAQTNVGTVVGMHIGEEHRKEAEKNHINVVIAGHMTSDSIGINLLLDELLKQEPLEIIPCSGFRRVTVR